MVNCPITNEELNETNSKEVFTEKGTKVLVHESVKTVTCSVCGKEHVILDENDMYLIYDDFKTLICRECQDTKKYVICSYCGKWELKKDMQKVGRYLVCSSCLTENFTTCADCGAFIAKDEAKKTHYGTYICSKCTRNYSACCVCGELLKSEDVKRSADNYTYCDNCFTTSTRVCGDCGQTYSRNMYGTTSVRNGEEVWYCDECKEKNVDIHNYGYKPTGSFRTTDKDVNDVKEFFGAEIEIGNCSEPKRYARTFLDMVNGDNKERNVYLKSDCSIVGGGFECVTKPMTRNYIYDEFIPKLRTGLSYLDENDFKGHDMGGIHIHVSKDAFTDRQMARIIPLVFTSNEDELNLWLTLTQRKRENLLHWGAIQENNVNGGDKARLSASILTGNTNWKNGVMTTRGAINIRSEASTVEFRLFNSSTRVDRILERYEVIFSLMDFADTDIEVSHVNYIKFIGNNKKKYQYLYDYLVEKEVINDDEKTINVFNNTYDLEIA